MLSRKAMGHKKFEDAKKGFEDVAKGWLERRKVREVKGRDVVWSWVDGDKWAGWAKSMYGIKAGGGEEGAVAISDPKVCCECRFGEELMLMARLLPFRRASRTGRSRSQARL